MAKKIKKEPKQTLYPVGHPMNGVFNPATNKFEGYDYSKIMNPKSGLLNLTTNRFEPTFIKVSTNPRTGKIIKRDYSTGRFVS